MHRRSYASTAYTRIASLLLVGLAFISGSCTRSSPATPGGAPNQPGDASAGSGAPIPLVRPVVTFIELGSVNCVPCRAMQPILEDVRDRYGTQVNVVFYDVWTKEGQPYAQKYGIRVIPTQVFLDREGKEFFRHEGFFPAEELLKVLEKGGVRL